MLSLLWSDSRDLTWIDSARTALYFGVFALGWIGMTGRRVHRLLFGLLLAAIAGTAGVTLGRLIIDPTPLFYVSRLNAPVGYINGEAAYFLLAFWPALAVMQSKRAPVLLRGACAGAAVVFVDLAVLAQSRGAIIALLVSALVMLTLLPDRLRRVWPLLWVAVIAGASLSLLTAVYSKSASTTGAAGVAVMRDAGWATLAGALLAAVGWAVVAFADGRTHSTGRTRTLFRAVTLAALAGALVLGGVAWAHRVGDPAKWVRAQYHEFTSSAPLRPGQDRYLSLAGQRYDLWHAAADEARARPLGGVGAGAYQIRYYQLRHQNRDLKQAHSIEFEILSERGVVGLLLFVAFLVASLVTARRRRNGLEVPPDEVVRVGLVGLVAYWLAHTSIDWFWVLPGITGIGFLALGSLCGMARGGPADDRTAGGFGRLRACALLITVLVLLGVGGRYLADAYLRSGQRSLAAAPDAARSAGETAKALAPSSTDARYLVAAAWARRNDYDRARGALLDAAKIEPRNFVTYVLLGDLATRAGRSDNARDAYRTAHRLNPLDASIAEAAR
jgi:hypothetical protein